MSYENKLKGSLGLGFGGVHPAGHPVRCFGLVCLEFFLNVRLWVLGALKAPALKTIAKSSCLEGILCCLGMCRRHQKSILISKDIGNLVHREECDDVCDFVFTIWSRYNIAV